MMNSKKINIIVKEKSYTSDFYILTVLILLLYFLLNNTLLGISYEIQTETNSHFSCSFLNFLSFFENKGKIILYIILLQYSNLYSCLIFWGIFYFSSYLSSILKIIFQEYRPYMSLPQLAICSCDEISYGNPSNTTLSFTLIFLFYLFKSSINDKQDNSYFKMRLKRNVKILIFIFSVIILSNSLFSNSNSVNQIFLGCGLGLLAYYFLFKIIKIDSSDELQFILICKNGYIYMLACFVITTLGFIIIYFYPIYDIDNTEMSSIITTLHSKCAYSLINFKIDLFILSFSFISIGLLFFSLWFELKFLFKNDETKFLKYTFLQDDDRFNNKLPWWNMYLKLIIYLVIISLYEYIISLIQITNDMHTYEYLWMILPLVNLTFLPILHIFLIRKIFSLLKLNNDTIKYYNVEENYKEMGIIKD